MKNMKLMIKNELDNFISKIKNKKMIKSVILFGSRARGDYSPFSDVDLIIIGDFKKKFIMRAFDLLILNESRFNFEIFCYTEEEFEKMFVKGNALILDAIFEGIPLEGKNLFNLYKRRMNEMIQKGLKRSSCTWVLI